MEGPVLRVERLAKQDRRQSLTKECGERMKPPGTSWEGSGGGTGCCTNDRAMDAYCSQCPFFLPALSSLIPRSYLFNTLLVLTPISKKWVKSVLEGVLSTYVHLYQHLPHLCPSGPGTAQLVLLSTLWLCLAEEEGGSVSLVGLNGQRHSSTW